jgi:S-formylglutathione hydrolase FrmB
MAGTWTTDRIVDKPCDVYEPTTRNVHGFVLIYLHGVHLNRLIDKTAFVQQFEELGLPVVAPHSQRSWWSDRICPEFDAELTAERYVVEHVLQFIKERWNSQPPRIGLFGTSMGGQGALRMAYKHPQLFPVVAAISPAVDYQHLFEEDEVLQAMYPDRETVRQDTALLHVHPLNWPKHQFFCCDPEDFRWHDSADRLRMKLWSLGVPHECDLETTGGGHSFDYYNSMAPQCISFVAHALDCERRRLV